MSILSFFKRLAGVATARYLGWVVVSVVLFMLIAVVDQREVFLPLFGLSRASSDPTTAQSGPAAEALVRSFLAALGQSYVQGSTEPLNAVAVSDLVREDYRGELAFSRGHDSGSLRLAAMSVVEVVAQGTGWSVLTDETWAPLSSAGKAPNPATARPSRLRYRYTLSRHDAELRLEEITPVLPEPTYETPHP